MPLLKGGEGADENAEEQRRIKLSLKNGPPAPGGRNKGFQLVLSLILLYLQEMQVAATETSSIHLEDEMEKEADRFAGKKAWTKEKIRREDPSLPSASARAAAKAFWR